MDAEFLGQIEDAALNAWPAPRQMVYDGWLLRFTGGSSKRVNSVNVRYPSALPMDQKIRVCEVVYARQQLPTIFRLPDPFTSSDLIQQLEDAGYETFDPTHVLGRNIDAGDALPAAIQAQQMPESDWIALRAALTGTPLSQWQVYRAILNGIVPEKVLLGLFVDDQPVACGMGVLEGAFLGYFSIYTAASMRRKGYGRAAMSALTRWGAERGASYGYLQVEGDNDVGLEFYVRLGFKICYRYHYSRKSGV